MTRIIALMLLGACGANHPSTVPPDSKSPSAELEVHTETSGEDGFFTHSHWIDTGKEVVVFDAQFTPAHARQVIDAIATQTRSPIKYLVITHPNPDKFNGASAFQAIGATVVASEATAAAMPEVHAYKKYYFVNVAKSFTEDTYPVLPQIDLTFERELELPLASDVSVSLLRLQHSGVASTQTIAYIEAAHALIVGDLIHESVHAWVEGGIVNGTPRPDLAAWEQTLDELLAYESARVFGGRGASAPVSAAVAAQKRYLSRVQTIAESYVAGLRDAKTQLAGESGARHQQAVAEQIAEAFPEHGLRFMLDYSLYGLLNELARRRGAAAGSLSRSRR